MDYTALIHQLRQQHAAPYWSYTPASLRAGMAVDRELAGQMVCEQCGCKGLTYEAWCQRWETRKPFYFSAVAICPQCHDATEY
jgi:hypothetical protein